MKAIIVYVSIAHGNTEKVAKVIAEALGAELCKRADVNLETFGNYDLVGFGSGVYNGKHHQDIFELVTRMPASSGKKAFVFSTSGYGTTKPNERLIRELVAKGLQVIGNFACKGFDTAGINRLYGGAAKGHPNEQDLQVARAFAENLKL